MANSWETAARKLQKDPWRIASLELKKRTPVETGIGENIARGFKKSSLAAPFVEPVKEEAATFGGRLSELIGELAGDIPAMTIGGSGGALAGAALGAPLGPIGAGVGALLGGGAGSLMAPTAVKSITREVKSRTPWEEAAANIAADLGQSALIGGLTAGAGKAAGPLLGRIGGKTGEKILSTGLGRGATELAGEVAGMTTAQHSLGEPINAENIAQNILLSGAMKGAHGIGSKLPVELPEMPSLFPKASALKKETFQKVRDYVGERAANIYKSQVHWQEQLQKAGGAEKFTDQATIPYYLQQLLHQHPRLLLRHLY